MEALRAKHGRRISITTDRSTNEQFGRPRGMTELRGDASKIRSGGRGERDRHCCCCCTSNQHQSTRDTQGDEFVS